MSKQRNKKYKENGTCECHHATKSMPSHLSSSISHIKIYYNHKTWLIFLFLVMKKLPLPSPLLQLQHLAGHLVWPSNMGVGCMSLKPKIFLQCIIIKQHNPITAMVTLSPSEISSPLASVIKMQNSQCVISLCLYVIPQYLVNFVWANFGVATYGHNSTHQQYSTICRCLLFILLFPIMSQFIC